MKQIARDLTDAHDGFLNGTRYLIHDRDPLFTEEFRMILKASGVRAIKLPAQSPNLDSHAERFVRSIKEECLSQIIPFGERHLRRAVLEYTEHYHLERNHQGLSSTLRRRRECRIFDAGGDSPGSRHRRGTGNGLDSFEMQG